MRFITAGRSRQFRTAVSEEDYDHLIQWLWTFAVSHKGGNLIYIRRSVNVGGHNVTILMHRVVLERALGPAPTVRHTAHHDDGNSINNQRENLFWKTPREQMLANLARYRFHAELAAESAYAQIPF